MSHDVGSHRMIEMSGTHPHDLNRLFARLVRDSNGKGRFYFLPGRKPVGDAVVGFDGGGAVGPSPVPNSERSALNPEQSGGANSEQTAIYSEQTAAYSEQSKALANEVRTRRRASKDLVEAAILGLCNATFVERKGLAEALKRAPETLRTHHLDRLVETGLLDAKNPDVRNDRALGLERLRELSAPTIATLILGLR